MDNIQDVSAWTVGGKWPFSAGGFLAAPTPLGYGPAINT